MMMRGVQRTVAVFDCYTSERSSLMLQEIANRIHLPKSTTFRIVRSLEQAGYLIRLEDQKYCLSFRFTRLAGMVMSTLNIRQVARPMMAELARRTNETVTLNTLSDRERVVIDVIDTPSPLMSMARPGDHVRLGKGATAKSLMVHLPKEELQKTVVQVAKFTGRNRTAITTELDTIRKNGYCVTHGERILGLSAISAPIRDANEAGRYCITITGPTARVEPKIGEYAKLVVKASNDISIRLGAQNTLPSIRSPAPRARSVRG